jgi:serpin B
MKRFFLRVGGLALLYAPIVFFMLLELFKALVTSLGGQVSPAPAGGADDTPAFIAIVCVVAVIAAASEALTGAVTILSTVALVIHLAGGGTISQDEWLRIAPLLVNLFVFATWSWYPYILIPVCRHFRSALPGTGMTPESLVMKRIWKGAVWLAVALTICSFGMHGFAAQQVQTTIKDVPCKSTGFALKLFTRQSNDKTNVVISPFSVYACLSMVANGARGTTLQELTNVLGCSSGDQLAALNNRNRAVLSRLALDNSGDTHIDVANAVYADSHTPFKAEFLGEVQGAYDAEIRSLDFTSAQTVPAINSWCAKKTHGKINGILDRLDPLEKMVVLNAVYFKSAWMHKFDKSKTDDGKFTTLSNKVEPIRMMHQESAFLYLGGPTFRAIGMPYIGGHQTMYIFLPNEGMLWKDFIAQFSETNWKNWLKGFSPSEHDMQVSLPRFRLESRNDLGVALDSMGLKNARKIGADFSGLIRSDYQAWISRVLQNTYLEVNEQGTEAAAVTAVSLNACNAYGGSGPPPFIVDRPFVCAIVDNDTDEILFLGSIVDIPNNPG